MTQRIIMIQTPTLFVGIRLRSTQSQFKLFLIIIYLCVFASWRWVVLFKSLRHTLVPIRNLLILMCHIQQPRLVEIIADDL